MALIHVIDDDLAILRPVAEAITQAGHLVRAHRGLSSYIELELAQAADLIVCDLLPVRAELEEVCRSLREKGKGERRPSIVNLTREPGGPSEAILRGYGVVATLVKPPRMVVLLELIARALSASDPLLGRPTASVATLLASAAAKQPPKKALATIALKQVEAAPETRPEPKKGARAPSAVPPMRAAPRFDAAFEVSFSSKPEYMKEYTQNISRGGVFVRTEQPPPRDTNVQLTLRVPELKEALVINALVVHIVDKGQGSTPGFGAKIADGDKAATQKWHQLIESVERAKAQKSRGPKVLLFGFTQARAAELVRSAGLLCRADVSLVPLQSWTTLQMETGRAGDNKKLVILDGSDEATRGDLFDHAALKKLAATSHVTVASVGAVPDAFFPAAAPIIRAGALDNQDLIAAIINWLDLPVRSHLRVPLSAQAEVHIGMKLVDARLLDVSIVGARFVSAGKHAIGDVVELSFGLPNGEHLSRIEAEVRWAKAESGRTICGATLRLDHRDAERDTLQAFIAEQAKLLRSFDALREGAPVVEEKVSKGTGQPDER